MSGAETTRPPVVQCRIGGAQTAAPKWPSPVLQWCMGLKKLNRTRTSSQNKILAIQYYNGAWDLDKNSIEFDPHQFFVSGYSIITIVHRTEIKIQSDLDTHRKQ